MGIEPTMPVLQTGNLPLVDPAVQLLHQLQVEPPPSPPNLGRSIHAKTTRSSWHLGPSRPLLAAMVASPLPIFSQSQFPGEKSRRPLPPVMGTDIPVPTNHPLHIVFVSPSSFSTIHVLSLSQASPSSGLTWEDPVQIGFHDYHLTTVQSSLSTSLGGECRSRTCSGLAPPAPV